MWKYDIFNTFHVVNHDLQYFGKVKSGQKTRLGSKKGKYQYFLVFYPRFFNFNSFGVSEFWKYDTAYMSNLIYHGFQHFRKVKVEKRQDFAQKRPFLGGILRFTPCFLLYNTPWTTFWNFFFSKFLFSLFVIHL